MSDEKKQEHTQSMWVRNTGTGGSRTWLFQRLTGLFIVLIILLHFGINHLIGTGEVTYDVVANRLSNPLWKCFDMAFLTFALYHGFAGVWVVVADYVQTNSWRLAIYSALILSGILLYALGTITILGFPFK